MSESVSRFYAHDADSVEGDLQTPTSLTPPTPARLMAKTEQWRSPHKGAKQLADEIYAQLETDAAHQAYGTVDDT